jgi:hypothetical protein
VLARDAADHPTVHRAASNRRELSCQNTNGAKVEKPGSLAFHCVGKPKFVFLSVAGGVWIVFSMVLL